MSKTNHVASRTFYVCTFLSTVCMDARFCVYWLWMSYQYQYETPVVKRCCPVISGFWDVRGVLFNTGIMALGIFAMVGCHYMI